jgi:Polyketide cyclase / dehydrase and lipid transport
VATLPAITLERTSPIGANCPAVLASVEEPPSCTRGDRVRSRVQSSSTQGRWRYEIHARSKASPVELWPLVGEAARWKEWSFLTRTFLLREGAPAPDGVGALRRFAVGPFGSCEEVVEWNSPDHLGYVARRGIPVRWYRADIRLRPDGEGTAIIWTGSLEPLVPGTGALVLAFTRDVVRLFAKELVRFADALRTPQC